MTPIGLTWRVLLALAGVGMGTASASVGFAPWQTEVRLGDLLTGWAMIAAGLVGTVQRASLRTGVLVVLGGFAWFLGDWSTVGGPVGDVASGAAFLHRGFLLHALFTAPFGRAVSMIERLAVVAAYAASLIPWIWTNAISASVASALAVGAGALLAVRAHGRERAPKRRAAATIGLLAVAIVGAFAIRGVWETTTASWVALAVYESALVVVAAAIVAISMAAARAGASADLVIELGAANGGGLEGALRSVLGDEDLVVGYATDVEGEFFDLRGDPVLVGSSALLVTGESGREIAVIRSDPGVLVDPAQRDSVIAAVRLDAANRALRADIEAQAQAVRASQRRIINAGDDEGRVLAGRLRAGVGSRLERLGTAILSASDLAKSEATKARLAAVASALERVDEDIDALGRGLHPRVLESEGLAGALAGIARDAVMPVDLRIDGGVRLPAQVELAVYFVCLEGLANIAKHASAAHASVEVQAVSSGRIRVEIRDDGIGGAELSAGVGLRGLADRIAVLGGVLQLRSPPGGGTVLSAEIPIEVPVGDPGASGTP